MDEERQKELELRRKIWKKKMTTAGLLFLCALIFFFAAGYLPPVLVNAGLTEAGAAFVCSLFKIIYAGSIIASVCVFAKTLHDPLTPKEAEELKERETAEKTGKTE